MSAIIGTFFSDKAVEVGNYRIARQVTFPGGWSRARVGIRAAINGPLSVATPSWGLGFCSGLTNILGDATTTHFLGARSSDSWAYGAGGASFATGNITYAKYVNAAFASPTATASFNSGYDISSIAERDHWSGIFVDIEKGSPNYAGTFYMFDGGPVVGNSLSQASFDSVMGVNGSLSGQLTPYFIQGATLAVDEGADGAFDAINFFWSGLTSTFTIAAFEFAIF